jgi:predicted AlkP superfamily phosphohydrolase/phosphomutase
MIESGSDLARPLLIIGLDGMNLTVPDSLAQGRMPFLSELVGNHALPALDAVIPNNSMACWTTWFTGLDPSHHGIPDFVLRDGYSGYYRLTQSTDRTAPALWDISTRRGQRSVVFNVPGTYPASPINGIMIGGAPALSRERLTHPAVLPRSIASLLEDYQGDLRFTPPVDTSAAERKRLASDLRNILDQQLALIRALLMETWDVFAGVVTMTDRLFHYFLPNRENPAAGDPELDDLLGTAFHRLDEFIEETFETWRGRAQVLFISDHGFVPCRYEFHIADWLENHAWFYRVDGPKKTLDSGLIDFLGADLARSLFLPAPASSLGLWRNPFFRGSENVVRDATESLREALPALRDPDGLPAFERVSMREEIYLGPCASKLPDMLIVPRGGEISLTSQRGSSLFTTPSRPGAHSLKSHILAPDHYLNGSEGHGFLMDLTDPT